MLKHKTSAYIPVELEDNGIAIPSLMSLAVHGAIIAFIVYFHKVPKIDIPPAIETSILTPQELADMQAQIMANRQSVNLSNSQSNESLDSQTVATENDVPADEISNTATTEIRRNVPIFLSSNDNPDDFEQADTAQSLDLQEYKDQIKQREEEYAAAQQAFQRALDNQMEAEMTAYEHALKDAEIKRQQAVKALREKEKNPADVQKPKLSDKEVPSSLKNNTPNKTDKATTQPSTDNIRATNSHAHGTNSSANAGRAGGNTYAPSAAEISAAVVAHIKPYWNTPNNRANQRITANVSVDANGNVLSVSVNSNDTVLKATLEEAIWLATPLTPMANTKYRQLKLHFQTQ